MFGCYAQHPLNIAAHANATGVEVAFYAASSTSGAKQTFVYKDVHYEMSNLTVEIHNLKALLVILLPVY